MTKLFGPLSALTVAALGLLAWRLAPSPDEAADALRALGTLFTVVSGLFSAVWWHQSASLAAVAERAPESNLLNAAAATTTGLALISGVFSNSDCRTPEGMLAGLAFVLLLAMSGDEIRQAAARSVRQGLRPRSMLAFAVLVTAAILFARRWLLR